MQSSYYSSIISRSEGDSMNYEIKELIDFSNGLKESQKDVDYKKKINNIVLLIGSLCPKEIIGFISLILCAIICVKAFKYNSGGSNYAKF